MRPGWKRVLLLGLGLVVAIAVLFKWLFPTNVTEDLDVIYSRPGGKPLKVDIYRPAGLKKARPGVIMIHGGGWVEGDKASQRDLARAFTKAGYVAVSVGYRLAKDSGSRYPAQVDDVRQAVRWVRANASYVGIDPARLGAFGHSAGGHLAAILGTTDPDDPGGSSRVQCVVDVCGPTDFTDETSPSVGPVIAWMVPNLFGKSRAEAPDVYRDASPVSHVDAKSAPTLIVHGLADEVVPIEQSRKLRDALTKAGVEVKLIEVPNEGHIFASRENADRMFRDALEFLGRHLKP